MALRNDHGDRGDFVNATDLRPRDAYFTWRYRLSLLTVQEAVPPAEITRLLRSLGLRAGDASASLSLRDRYSGSFSPTAGDDVLVEFDRRRILTFSKYLGWNSSLPELA